MSLKTTTLYLKTTPCRRGMRASLPVMSCCPFGISGKSDCTEAGPMTCTCTGSPGAPFGYEPESRIPTEISFIYRLFLRTPRTIARARACYLIPVYRAAREFESLERGAIGWPLSAEERSVALFAQKIARKREASATRAARTCTLSPVILTCPKQGKEAAGLKQTKTLLHVRRDVNTDAALSSRAVPRARFCIPVRVRRHLCGTRLAMPTILEMLVTWYPSNSLLVSMKTERERERERERNITIKKRLDDPRSSIALNAD